MRKFYWILLCLITLTGFGWGKKETKSTTVPATRPPARVTTTTRPPAYSAPATSTSTVPAEAQPAGSPQPVNRLLTSGDPETRKATIERLARLRRAMEQKQQLQGE
ncbi:MAG: hypothetical protein HY714_04750 [Candidatus Omnitrophica bacterium]|nr:hypothetical protein [Candidatus Omnitrophota bacterium]